MPRQKSQIHIDFRFPVRFGPLVRLRRAGLHHPRRPSGEVGVARNTTGWAHIAEANIQEGARDDPVVAKKKSRYGGFVTTRSARGRILCRRVCALRGSCASGASRPYPSHGGCSDQAMPGETCKN